MQTSTVNTIRVFKTFERLTGSEEEANSFMNHLTAMVSEVNQDKQHFFVEKIELELERYTTKEEFEQFLLNFEKFKFDTLKEFMNLRVEFKQDMANFKTEVKQDIADLRTEFKQDMSNLKTEMIKWTFSIVAGQTLLLLGMIYFLLQMLKN